MHTLFIYEFCIIYAQTQLSAYKLLNMLHIMSYFLLCFKCLLTNYVFFLCEWYYYRLNNFTNKNRQMPFFLFGDFVFLNSPEFIQSFIPVLIRLI